MPLYFWLPNSLFGDELSFVGETGEYNFVTPQVHNRIREKIKYLSEYFFNQFVCLVESNIKWTHVTHISKSACHFGILGCSAPTGSMARGIQFGNDPYASD